MIPSARLILIGAAVCWLGCVDSIDISLPDNVSGRLVIEGSVDRTETRYVFSVFVTRTSAIDESLERYVEPATINMIYQGAEIFELNNGEARTFSIGDFHDLFGGEPASAQFGIEVEVDGELYSSEPQHILDSPPPGELSTQMITREELNEREFILERSYVELRITSDLRNSTGQLVSLLWDVQSYYQFQEIVWDENDFFFNPKICYVFELDKSNEINFINALGISSDRITSFKINEKFADYKFHSGHLYQVIQRTLDANAAEYWDQVSQAIQREGTIFDDPPGRAISNISSTANLNTEVLGYFYASAVDTIYKLATPGETGNQRHLCAQIIQPSPCCACLDIAGSSLEQPKNWIQ
ncbi:MAG: DUF4249 family protein [Saprospiraceae bacterium]|nr:DUF4249 family protein [Saprospiraceae bacterium]